MKYKRLVPSLLLTGVIVGLLTTPTLSEEKSSIGVDKSTTSGEKSARSTQQPRLVTNSRFVKPITEIRSLSEIERPITSAQMLVQSPTPPNPPSVPRQSPQRGEPPQGAGSPNLGGRQGGEVIQVTGVKANPTKKGVEVILQTSKGQALQLVNRSAGKNFIVDIPNAQLRLPSGDAFTFRSTKPITGVTEITVTNFDANTIRVTVQGEAGVPTVELFDSPNEGLIFGVASAATAASGQQQPQTQNPTPPSSPNLGEGQREGSQQPTNQTQQSKPSASGDEPIELLVTGQQDRYRVSNTTSATRTDTPRRDIPQSIQVIPQEVLRDQQVNNAREALKNVPGVAPGESPPRGFNTSSVRIRGFDSSRNNLRNGIADDTVRFLGFDSAIIDRIEVLKGPASVLYGQGALGGTLNYVTKQPLRDPYYSIEASIGNFDFYRGGIDLSGPLNPSQSVLYRLNVGGQSTKSFIDFYEEQRYAVSPVIAWQIGDRTKLTLEAEYFQFNQPKGEEVGLPAVGTVLRNPNGKISRSLAISEPSSGSVDSVTRTGFRLEHRFSDNWQVNSTFRASFVRLDREYIGTSSLSTQDNRILTRSETPQEFKDNYYGLDNYVVGKFATGSIQHQLVAGFSLSRLDSNVEVFTRSLASLDVFNPVYGRPAGQLRQTTNSRFTGDTLGIYIQDQITLFKNFKVLLGGRFDIANQTRDNLLRSITEFQQQEVFSPRVGIVYQPITPISLYASYARSFLPTQSVLSANLLQPERGTQYEVGIKADLTDRLSATFAYYDLARTNAQTTDPNNRTLVIQTGKQRSRGVEFDVTGEILPGWNIIAGYAYTDARVEADRTYPSGNFINNVPEHSFNLWTTYELQSGGLQGLGFGVGLFYVGDRQGNLENDFELPSYLRTDAAIFYKRDGFRVALNFKNLFDIDYFESAQNSRQRVFYGDPLTVQGTISVQF